jgi:hypothetical protein
MTPTVKLNLDFYRFFEILALIFFSESYIAAMKIVNSTLHMPVYFC